MYLFWASHLCIQDNKCHIFGHFKEAIWGHPHCPQTDNGIDDVCMCFVFYRHTQGCGLPACIATVLSMAADCEYHAAIKTIGRPPRAPLCVVKCV